MSTCNTFCMISCTHACETARTTRNGNKHGGLFSLVVPDCPQDSFLIKPAKNREFKKHRKTRDNASKNCQRR